MKTKDMKSVCKRVKAIINTSRPSLPILACVKVESNGESLTLTGYNLEVGSGIVITVPDTTRRGGFSTCVNFADLEKIVGKLKADNLELSAIAKKVETHGYTFNDDPDESESVPETFQVIDLTIRSGGLSFTLNGRAASDFPPLPGPDSEVQASIVCRYSQLAGELSFVLKATDHDTPRNFTSGVLFDFKPESKVVIVGTDGHRLHQAVLSSGPLSSNKETPFLLPVKAIDSLLKLNLDIADTVELAFYESLVCWKVPDVGLSGVLHLMDTPFPDYEKVIPDLTNVFNLDCKPTVQALDALSIIAHEHDGRDMVVINANGRLNLSVKAESTGKADADLQIEHVQGADEILVALNIDYFTDILKANESIGRLSMSNEGALEPCRFDYPDSDRIAILMPVRLPE